MTGAGLERRARPLSILVGLALDTAGIATPVHLLERTLHSVLPLPLVLRFGNQALTLFRPAFLSLQATPDNPEPFRWIHLRSNSDIFPVNAFMIAAAASSDMPSDCFLDSGRFFSKAGNNSNNKRSER